MNTEVPERINVMKVVTYDVAKIVAEMCNPENGWVNGLTNTIPKPHEISIEMLMEYIDGWIEEDFPNTRIRNLIIQDENGEEIN